MLLIVFFANSVESNKRQNFAWLLEFLTVRSRNKMTAKLSVAASRELILCALWLMLLPRLLLSDNFRLVGMNLE